MKNEEEQAETLMLLKRLALGNREIENTTAGNHIPPSAVWLNACMVSGKGSKSRKYSQRQKSRIRDIINLFFETLESGSLLFKNKVL
jgi:hypothetical protein